MTTIDQPDPETLADDAADDAHTERWRAAQARGRHDAMCPALEPCDEPACTANGDSLLPHEWKCACALIARVRADQDAKSRGVHGRVRADAEQVGYRLGLRDAHAILLTSSRADTINQLGQLIAAATGPAS